MRPHLWSGTPQVIFAASSRKLTAFPVRRLFRDPIFLLLFLAAAIATFPLFVPPFFLPLYAGSLGLSPSWVVVAPHCRASNRADFCLRSAGAGLVAGFNFSSAVGRLACGFMCDKLGAVNTLLFSLVISAGSMLVLWPLSDSIAPLVAFAVINVCLPLFLSLFPFFGSLRDSRLSFRDPPPPLPFPCCAVYMSKLTIYCHI